ncbi:MAG: NTP transferase domain-containing protein [Anaerolineae bacterium]|nr:NTP transferase domain-containing protein [Anaerolineae bacterium]
MQGIILAAGKGSRLHPITTTRSKAMLPILGQPMVARVMQMLVANGVRDFVLVVSPTDAMIMEYFVQEYGRLEPDVQVEFVFQAERRGMADALARAAGHIHGPFILSACDNLVATEHVAALIAHFSALPDAQAVLSLMRISPDLLGKTGVVEWRDGQVLRIVEKPRPQDAPSDIASLPLYIFRPSLLDYLPRVPVSPRGEYELQDAIQMLIDDRGGVYGLLTDSRLTVTNAADLLAINRHYLLQGGDQPQLAPRTVGQNTHLITPLRIEEGVEIGRGCVIGPRVYIERDCRIGDNVIIKDAVVLRNAVVAAGSQIVGDVVA